MRKLTFLVLIFIFAYNLQAQQFRPNGKCFTPKGTLRVMMLFVGFGPDFDTTHWVNGWDGKKDFPDAYYNDKLFYSDISLFDTPIIPKRDSNNISRWYYEMSKHSSVPFKLVVDAYKVNLNPDSIRTVKSWEDLDKGTLKQFVIDNPNFDWTLYDNRKNIPDFMFDNSAFYQDSILDYLIIFYRFKNKQDFKKDLPFPSIQNDNDNINASTSTSIFSNYTGFGYKFNAGYRHRLAEGPGGNAADIFGLFIHEVGHTLIGIGEYGGHNCVAGSYFYLPAYGWGTLNVEKAAPFRTALCWERYMMGWNEIQVDSQNSKLDYPLQQNNKGFILRDFATTGDMVCIEIPKDTLGDKQRLWLENHQMNTVYDNRTWREINSTYSIPASSPGLYASIDDMSGNRDYIGPLPANAVKYLHSKGNYDYILIDSIVNPSFYWVTAFNFYEGAANPYSGNGRWDRIRIERNGNINIKNDDYITVRNGVITYDFAGIGASFVKGQRLGIATNPPLVNYPEHKSYSLNGTYTGADPLILNGVEVTVVDENPIRGEITVSVERNKVSIDNNFRMAAKRIELMDITGAVNRGNLTSNPSSYDTIPDLIIKSNKILTMNRSGSVNRSSKRGDRFNEPTIFTCHKGSRFYLEPNSRVELKDSTHLVLRPESRLIIDTGAVVYVECGSAIDSVDTNRVKYISASKPSNRGMIVYQNCNSVQDTTGQGGAGGGTGGTGGTGGGSGGGGTGTTTKITVVTITPKDTTQKPKEPYNEVDTAVVRPIIDKLTSICRNSDGDLQDKDIFPPDSTYLPDSKWFIGIGDVPDTIKITEDNGYLFSYTDSLDAQKEILNYLTRLQASDSLLDIDTLQSIYIYLLLANNTLFRWEVQITDIPTLLADHFNNNPDSLSNIIISEDGKSASFEIDNANLSHTIPLPALSDTSCTYVLIVNGDSTYFAGSTGYPKIENDTLYFALDSNICEPISLTLSYDCVGNDCPEEYVLNIQNTDCWNWCGGIDVSFEKKCNNIIMGGHLLGEECFIKVTAKSPQNTNIVGVKFEKQNALIPGVWCPPVSIPSDSLVWLLPADCKGVNDSVDMQYKICFDIDTGIGTTTCCDFYTYRYACQNLWMQELYIPDKNWDIVEVGWGLNNLPPDGDTVTGRIDDIFGNTRLMIYSCVPVKLSDTIIVDISSLPAGLYNVVFTLGNEVVTKPLTKYDEGIIEYADIIPSVTTGNCTINYRLTELPKDPLAISVVDKVTGVKQMFFTSMPSGLLGSISLNVSSLIPGPYIIIIEVENSMFYIPKTLDVIKQ